MKYLKLAIIITIIIILLVLIVIITGKEKGKKDNLQDNKKIHFISYGNDRFKKSKKRIKKEAEYLDIFHKIKIYEPNDIDILFKNKYKNHKECYDIIKNHKRGGGFYLWKPIIIYEELLLMNDGDILLYADSGCELINNKNEINKSLNFKNTCDLTAYKTQGGLRTKFGNLNVINQIIKNKDENTLNNFFNANNGYEIEGGRIIIKKTSKSMNFFQQWMYYALNHPIYFTDYNIKLPNDNSITHRHDQSIFNLIYFNNDCKELNLNHDIKKWIIASRIIK